MEEQQRTPTPEQGQPEHGFSSNEGHMQGTKEDQLSQTHRSPIRLFIIIIIVAIFMAEVVAMMVVQVIEPVPYYQVTLIDAGIMTILIFPVLYFLSFRPLLREIEIGRQTEQSLLRSRDLQEEFFDSIDTLIAYMDCDFKFIRVNDAYARASGYPTEYFRGKNHFALYPHAENQEIFRWVVQTGDGYVAHEKSFEYPDKPERGITYWNWSLQPVKGLNETVEGLVLSLVDVTERKRAEERLRKVHDELELRVQERTDELRIANSELEDEINVRKRTEEALRKSELGLKHAQEIAHLGSWELDLLRNQLSWSDEVYRIFGLQPQEFKATYEAFLEIVHPEDRAAVDQVYSSSLRDGKAGYEIEHRIIRRSSGEVRTVHEKCEHLRNEAGQIVRSGGMVHDITERKQAEEELRAARDELEIHVRERTKELADANRELLNEIYERKEIERQLRVQATAMEAAASGIVITDREGKVQWTNPALAQMSGYDAREHIGQNMQIFKSGQHGTEYYRELWDPILSGQVWRGETTNRHKDGRLYVEEQTITPVRDDQGQITQFIAIKQDITERKQAEEALRKSEEKF
ncbi:MAG TPA: PAS domain S-box protein, partial [Anaerolineales bacterium]